MPELGLEKISEVFVVTLNNPSTGNAINSGSLSAHREILAELESVKDNSAVVVNTPGVDYKIDLGILGSSKDTTMLIYSWADPCGDSDTIWVTTTSQLSAAISQPDPICDTDSAINLIDSVADLGGKFSGVGITNDTLGTFDPSVSGPGNHVIEYEILGNCGDLQNVTIVVNATPNPEITNTDTVFCQNDSVIELTTTPSGGSWIELDSTFGALDTLKSEFKNEEGGLSGEPLQKISNDIII